MPVYGAFEAKNKLSELLGRASRGKEVVITRRGKVSARLVPCDEKRTGAVDLLRRIEKTRKRAAQWRKTQRRSPLTVEEILKLRDEGRK